MNPITGEVPLEDDPDLFDQVIQAIDDGEDEPGRHISIQIDNALRDAICAAQVSGKTSSINVAVKVKPDHERRVFFAASVTSKLPRPPVPAVMLYADANGNVHKQDPAQERLNFYDPATRSRKES